MPSKPNPLKSMPTFTALTNSDVIRTKIHRVLQDNVFKVRKREFANAAARFNGRVRYAPQEAMLGAALDCVNNSGNDPSDTCWLPDHWDGVCAGLACEWIMWRVRGGDIIPFVLDLTETFKKGVCDAYWLRDVLIAQEDQRSRHRRALFESVSCVHTSTFKSQYPFNSLFDRFNADSYHQGLRPSRYYYITSSGHAMAAYVNGKGRLSFYDPSIGEATGLSSTSFLPILLKNTIDARTNMTRLHPEKFLHYKAKTLHPNKIDQLESIAKKESYTFWEYKDRQNRSFPWMIT